MKIISRILKQQTWKKSIKISNLDNKDKKFCKNIFKNKKILKINLKCNWLIHPLLGHNY